MANFKPTQEQQNVVNLLSDYFAKKYGPGYDQILSVFLSAVAGSGKTSTIGLIEELISRIEQENGVHIEWCSLSFNSVIARRANEQYREKGARQVAKTTNQLGRSILAAGASVGQCRAPKNLANKFKYKNLIEKYCKKNSRNVPAVNRMDPQYLSEAKLIGKIQQLVSAARSTYCDPTSEAALIDIIMHYSDIKITPLSPYWRFIWTAIDPIIKQGIEIYSATGDHDFDDQLYLPLALDIAAPIYDLICIDEAQDLNRVRTELIKRAIRPDGVLFFVGDRRQAIQGFAYADTNSVNNIIAETSAVELPLTCCWRCDSDIIRLAQVINPEIKARPNAPAGVVELISERDYVHLLNAGYWSPDKSLRVDADMVVCRVTADLVKGCLSAIRAGKYSVVRGKDIGANIVKLLNDVLENYSEAYNLKELSGCINDLYNVRSVALMKTKDGDEELDKLSDLIDTLQALLDGYWMTSPASPSIAEFKAFIDDRFAEENSDDKTEGPRPVVFSTIHKAKGLETDTVYILRGDIMPHPMAVKSGKDWQLEQEDNIIYVAVTRPKHTLRFVGYVPDVLRPMFDLINPPAEAVTVPALALDELEREYAEVFCLEAPEVAPVVVEAVEVAQTAPASAPVVRAGRGRKAKAKEDRAVKTEFRTDPAIKAALTNFVESLATSGDFSDIIPVAGNKLSMADVITQALLDFDPFKAYFQTAPEYQQYRLRQTGPEIAPAPEVANDDQPDPDDDGPDGPGGLPGLDDPEDYDINPLALPEIDYQPAATVNGWHDWTGALTSPDEPGDPVTLFPDLEDAAPVRTVQRVFYHCPKWSCKKHWYVDYYKLADGRLYRLEDGKTVYADQDFNICPYCANKGKYLKKTFFKGSFSSKRKCDSRCWNAAPGSPCTCACGGVNHATGSSGDIKVEQIGANLLQSAELTEVGR